MKVSRPISLNFCP